MKRKSVEKMKVSKFLTEQAALNHLALRLGIQGAPEEQVRDF